MDGRLGILADSRATTIDYRRQWTLIILGGVAGLLIGWIAWISVLSLSQATFIISIGQVQQGVSTGSIGQQGKLDQAFLEDPGAFVERVRSPAFASAIAKRTGISELTDILPARQYGGRGMLSTRSLRTASQGVPNLIEVRIAALSPDVAGNAARAAADQIVEEHTKLLEPFTNAMEKRRELLQQQIALLHKSEDQLSQKIDKSASQQGSELSDAVLLGAKLLSEKRALDLELSSYDATITTLNQDARKTIVLFAPATSAPRKAWAIMAPLAGAISGMIFVFLALRVWQEIVARRKRVSASEID